MINTHLGEEIVNRISKGRMAFMMEHNEQCYTKNLINLVYADPVGRYTVAFTNCSKCNMKMMVVIRRTK